jgi:hypothetical protein
VDEVVLGPDDDVAVAGALAEPVVEQGAAEQPVEPRHPVEDREDDRAGELDVVPEVGADRDELAAGGGCAAAHLDGLLYGHGFHDLFPSMRRARAAWISASAIRTGARTGRLVVSRTA